MDPLLPPEKMVPRSPFALAGVAVAVMAPALAPNGAPATAFPCIMYSSDVCPVGVTDTGTEKLIVPLPIHGNPTR